MNVTISDLDAIVTELEARGSPAAVAFRAILEELKGRRG